jgi:hypothetical protein
LHKPDSLEACHYIAFNEELQVLQNFGPRQKKVKPPETIGSLQLEAMKGRETWLKNPF